MTASVRAVGMLLAAVPITAAACTSADDEPRPVAAPTTASPGGFESAKHGYLVELPADWGFVEGAGNWTGLDQFGLAAEVPGEDLAAPMAASAAGWFVANSMALPKGMSPQEWLTELDGLVTPGQETGCDVQRTHDVLAGIPATVLRHECDDQTTIGRSLVHEGRGYYFTVGYPTSDAATEATLDGIASSIRFTR